MSWLKNDGKTEKPTPRRRRKAREEGAVARSMELNSAVVLTTASLMLLWFGAGISTGLMDVMQSVFRHMGTVEITTSSLSHDLALGMKALALMLGPFLLAVMLGGLAVNIGQVGFRVSLQSARPRLSRLNPLMGLQRILSATALVELGKSLLKVALVGGVIYLTIKSRLGELYALSDYSIGGLGSAIGRQLGRVFLLASLSLIVIGLLDFFYNRYEFEKSIKMTKDEVKEEMKQSEGDPHVKGKIRETMYKISRRRMMKKLPEADVVITNPVHLAVALQYDRRRHPAPVLVAKGARKLAERIKETAREHNIPIVENPPLAQMLYRTIEVGQEIPVDLYKAVAEVLAYVYRLKRKIFAVA